MGTSWTSPLRTSALRVAGFRVGGEADDSVVPPSWRPLLVAVSSLVLVSALGLVATAYVALRTSRGLRLDRAAVDAVSSPTWLLGRLYEGLGWVSVPSVALLLLVCVAVAAVRRRVDLAVGALVVIGGANLTTQILKFDLFTHLSPGPQPNSLPSGHTTVALSIALAAVMVAPSAWRATVATGVSATATLVGVALVLGRYHRPSDVIAATFVCLGWAAVALLAAAWLGHRSFAAAHRISVPLGALAGACMVGVLLVSRGVTMQPGPAGLGIVTLGSIGLACAVSVAAVAHVADRHLG
jgi:membrane-associated phospholipid phosphatase